MGILNLLFTHPVRAYATPVFFTATAMIGMVALAGIVVPLVYFLLYAPSAATHPELVSPSESAP